MARQARADFGLFEVAKVRLDLADVCEPTGDTFPVFRLTCKDADGAVIGTVTLFGAGRTIAVEHVVPKAAGQPAKA